MSNNYVKFSDFIQQPDKLYQIAGERDTNDAYIFHIGNGNKSQILLHDLDTFVKCQIISYILDDNDISNAISTRHFKMLGLHMFRHKTAKTPFASIVVEYKIDSSDFKISTNELKHKTYGRFVVYAYLPNRNEPKQLYEFEKYPGHDNMVEKLINFMTHEDILPIYSNE